MTNNRKNGSILVGILCGLLAVVLLTALAVGLLLSGTWLYNFEIDVLDIVGYSGFDKATILSNYRAVIRFLSPFHFGEFEMPDLPASPGGTQHFDEVKNIVIGLYIAGLICLLSLILLIIFVKKKLGPRTFFAAGVATINLPLLLLAGIMIDFDSFFVLFHKIFFKNDYWIFDSVTDPVIRILPETYFMHCAVVIVLFWVLGSIAFFLISHRERKKVAEK